MRMTTIQAQQQRLFARIAQVEDEKLLLQVAQSLDAVLGKAPKLPKLSDGEQAALAIGRQELASGQSVSEERFWAAVDRGIGVEEDTLRDE
jgi:hypothetical protein